MKEERKKERELDEEEEEEEEFFCFEEEMFDFSYRRYYREKTTTLVQQHTHTHTTFLHFYKDPTKQKKGRKRGKRETKYDQQTAKSLRKGGQEVR